jgi:PAS domain S-box-containing protein
MIMKRSQIHLDNLQKYASYLYKNHLAELAKTDMERNKEVDLPLLKAFTHLSEQELLTLSFKSMRDYLVPLMEGRALEAIIQSMEDWKADKLPGIARGKIAASDIALIYNVRKHGLFKFLPLYTQDLSQVLQIVKETEDFYTFQESLAIQTYTEIQQDELRQSESRLKNAQSLANMGNWEYDPEKQTVIWSDQLYKIYGFKVGIPITMEMIQKAVLPEDLDMVSRSISEAISKQGSFRIEYRIRHTDGSIRAIQEQGNAIRNAEGKFILKGISKDITERKEAETKLRESQHFIEKITSSTPQIIYVNDFKTGKIIFINKKIEDYLGYSAKEIINMNINEAHKLIHSEDQGDMEACRKKFIDSKEGYIFTNDIRVKHANGEWRWFRNQEMVFRRDKNNFPVQIIGTSYDISEQKAAEEQLNLLNQQLEERVRERTSELQENMMKMQKINNDLDNFIYTASHDLKAPISNIEGLISALFSEIPENENIHFIREMLEASIERFKTTIKDLTEITKVQKGVAEDIEEVNLAEMSEEIKGDMKEDIIQTGANIFTDFKIPAIRFSRKNLRSIVYNLLSNAIKYRSPDKAPQIKMSTEDAGKYILFKISDNGLGISEENKGKVFGMFKRFHDHVEGTGIGLYIVKRIIDNAGGRIEVESNLGKGTTFNIYFKK